MKPTFELLESRDCPTVEVMTAGAIHVPPAELQTTFEYHIGTESLKESVHTAVVIISREFAVVLTLPTVADLPQVGAIFVQLHVDPASKAMTLSWSVDNGQTWTQPIVLEKEAILPANAATAPAIDWQFEAWQIELEKNVGGSGWFEGLEFETESGEIGVVVATRENAVDPPQFLSIVFHADGTSTANQLDVPTWMNSYVAPWENPIS